MMGLYPGSKDSKVRATTYGPLPTHGRTELAVVLHSTETRGLPGYGGGIRAPHYTYFPARRTFYQHAEVEDGYVGTMKGHTTGGHGNCKAIQVEIVAFSNRQIADRYETGLWVGDFTDDQYGDLSEFFVWVRDRYRVSGDVTPTPDAGWRSGTGSPYRLSDDEWEAFSGLTAHGAIPRNSHWDTGVLDLERIAEGASMWADDITDKTWMTMFHSGVPGVEGFGRYYCSNDGTVDWSTETYEGLGAPWGTNPHAPTNDGDASYAEKVHALNYLLSGFAEAAGTT